MKIEKIRKTLNKIRKTLNKLCFRRSGVSNSDRASDVNMMCIEEKFIGHVFDGVFGNTFFLEVNFDFSRGGTPA